jgi:arginyl-tRNA--protein-N-Asp/Glu arginylyltransferase
MPRYHSFAQIEIDPSNVGDIEKKYCEGYVYTRFGNSLMQQVRSVRVRLAHFRLSSENRRVLKHHPTLILHHAAQQGYRYQWAIGKMAKDFYERFGGSTFSANKVKELFTSPQSAMNAVLEYHGARGTPWGYCLCFETPALLHYAYPFYERSHAPSLGMAMMVRAVMWAKEQGKEYIYLGSIRNETSLYKFQFAGTEWFDGRQWREEKPASGEVRRWSAEGEE